MSAQRASGTPSTRSSTAISRARNGLVNAGSPTNGLGLTHSLAPLFAANDGLLPTKVVATLVRR